MKTQPQRLLEEIITTTGEDYCEGNIHVGEPGCPKCEAENNPATTGVSGKSNVKIITELRAQLAAERERGRALAMMALQSERYTTDLEYRDATDAALAVERDDRISWQELYEKTNDQLAAAVEALKMIEFDDDGVPQAWPKKDTIDAALAKIGEKP